MNSIDWTRVRKVLVVRLRSIGDTVLATPSLIALRRFLPDTQIDVLLEDWVAPVLDGFDAADNVIAVDAGTRSRLAVMRRLGRERYDVVFNLHGGTTSTFFAAASRARHKVGYSHYRYSFLYDHLLSSSADFWKRAVTHSAEQQLALLGSVGVPVEDRPKSRLAVTDQAAGQIEGLLRSHKCDEDRLALLHPAAAFATKQWPAENFARAAEFVNSLGLFPIFVAAPGERAVLQEISKATKIPFNAFWDLTLPQVTALAERSEIFVGNDSGIAHIAAAVGTPTVVIFGSSNRDHWYPWTDAPSRVVFHATACQPCPGYECKVFGEPRCILEVRPADVTSAIESLLAETKKSGQ